MTEKTPPYTTLVHANCQVFEYIGDAMMRYSVLSTYTQT